MTGPPVLWHFPISHYNEKARWALDWKGIPHVRRALAMSYVPRALWATGQATLPILHLDGQAIADSTRIIEALERLQPEPALYPRDEAARRRALALEDFFDEEVGHAVRTAIVGPLFAHDPVSAGNVLTTAMGPGARRAVRAVLPAFRAFYKLRHGIDDAAIAVAPARVRAGLDRIAAELGPSGHLVGDAFSVADLTAAALFSPIVLPLEFPYPPPEPRPRHVLALRASLEGHPAFRWVLETYRRLPGNVGRDRGLKVALRRRPCTGYRGQSRCTPSSLLSRRSNVPNGRCPALRATSRTRQSEKPSDGVFR